MGKYHLHITGSETSIKLDQKSLDKKFIGRKDIGQKRRGRSVGQIDVERKVGTRVLDHTF